MASDKSQPTPEVTQLMQRFKSRDTKPEIEVRRRLHARGLRYRLHMPVPQRARRTIDIAFPRRRVAVFIDGCYWHACPEHGKVPARNSAWWADKLRHNVERDLDTTQTLEQDGWTVIRAWEHEDPTVVANAVERAVRRAT